jgi:Rrf2 family protein
MAIHISTRSRYGLRLMLVLAENHGRGVTLMKEVSRLEGISEKYLGQIIIPLRSSGLVASQRGSHGGYHLARPPGQITVRDVVEAIEGRIVADPDADKPEAAQRPVSAVTARVWKKLGRDMEDSLSAFTLAELVRQAREMHEPAANYVI